PKFTPVIVTGVPTLPDAGDRVPIHGAVLSGGGPIVTVNHRLLLAWPPTLTTTAPDVAAAGTGTTMLVALQLVGVAAVPLNVTVLVPRVAPKFAPVNVTTLPTTPDTGAIVVTAGGG